MTNWKKQGKESQTDGSSLHQMTQVCSQNAVKVILILNFLAMKSQVKGGV